MSTTNYTSELTECLAPYSFCHAAQKGELEAIEINHPLFRAEVLLQGAQLLSFKPKNQLDWIWLSEEAEYKKGTSVRGGIPVCWPWFGNADKNPEEVQAMIGAESAPAHGFARTQDWVLKEVSESESAVCLTLALEVEASALWQAKATLTLEIEFSQTNLSLSLITQAHEQSIELTQALHTYFPTSDIYQTRVVGFDACSFTDALDNWSEKLQKGDILFTEETDRVYQAKANTIQRLVTPEQVLTLEANSQSAIVWNPWVKKSEGLSQFDNTAWQRMFCVETANALADKVSLQPGQSHCLSLVIKSES